MTFFKKNGSTYIMVLFIGVVIGLQLPGLVLDSTVYRQEHTVMEQIKVSPHDSNNWVLISQLRLKRGDKKGCIDAAKMALTLNPDNIIAMEKIAYTYIDMGDLDNGRKWLEKAMSLTTIRSAFRNDMLNRTLTQIDDIK